MYITKYWCCINTHGSNLSEKTASISAKFATFIVLVQESQINLLEPVLVIDTFPLAEPLAAVTIKAFALTKEETI